MAPTLGKIVVGTYVNIKRSDGQIHKANVECLDEEDHCVYVRWSEKEEIDLECIFSLNPELAAEEEISLSPVTPPPPTPSKMPKLSRPGHGRPSSSSSQNQHPLHLHNNPLNPHRARPKGDTVGGGGLEEAIVDFVQMELCSLTARRKLNCVKEVGKLQQQELKKKRAQVILPELVPPQLVPPQLIPPQLVPPQLILPELVPPQLIPPRLVPPELVPPQLIPPHLVPPELVPTQPKGGDAKELKVKDIDVITIPSKDVVMVHEPKQKVDLTPFLKNHTFRFDHAFDDSATNEMVYRATGQNAVNAHSSRSHAIFDIILRSKGKLHGKFSLIDLAGNERAADTCTANGQTQKEGAKINESLLTLKVSALKIPHQSKL
ncbi:unnamed protein product [Leuciscus chuanchicus]